MYIGSNYTVYIAYQSKVPGTYDHRVWRTGLPVRSAVLKPHAGRLVVGWVTTSESLLLYVFVFGLIVQRLSLVGFPLRLPIAPLGLQRRCH
jgi:hypothetical protein